MGLLDEVGIMPIKIKVEISKVDGVEDEYRVKYEEYVDTSIGNKGVKNTFEMFDKISAKVSIFKGVQLRRTEEGNGLYYEVKVPKRIAFDFIAGEVLPQSTLGSMTLMDLFKLLTLTMAGELKKAMKEGA